MIPTAARKIDTLLRHAHEDIARTFSDLIRIPTVNPYSGDPHPSGEAEGQQWVARQIRRMGGTCSFVPVPPDIYRRAGILGPRKRDWTSRRNVVGRFPIGTGRGPTFVLNAHIDTVGVSDFCGDPFSAVRRRDTLTGRGASDCKCGIVAGLYAIRALQQLRSSINANILFESVVDEECNGSGAGTLACCLAGVRGDYCLVLDGSAGHLYTGCQGLLTAEMTVVGKARHGSAGGVNAAEELLIAKRAIDRLAAERARTVPDCRMNVGVLRAGLAPWTVPNRGWLAANINYSYSEAVRSRKAGHGFCGFPVRRRLETFMHSVSRRDPWLALHPPALEWVKDLPPYRMDDADDPVACRRLLAAAHSAYAAIWRRTPDTSALAAWGDASHLVRIGKMPVIGMGAGLSGTSHSDTEHNPVSNVRKTAAMAAWTILELSAG